MARTPGVSCSRLLDGSRLELGEGCPYEGETENFKTQQNETRPFGNAIGEHACNAAEDVASEEQAGRDQPGVPLPSSGSPREEGANSETQASIHSTQVAFGEDIVEFELEK